MGGVETDNDGADRADRPLRRGRGRVRLGPRREPARRQLADGDDHLRPSRRAAPRPSGRSSHTTIEVAASAVRDAERELHALLDRNDGRAAVADPRRARRVDARELRRLPPRGADGRADRDHRRARASATSGVVVEDKGQVFNSDLTQALELGYLLDTGRCMLQAGIARKESRGAHSRPDDYPTRDDENFLKHSISRWNGDGPELYVQGGPHDALGADGEDVLARADGPQDLAVQQRDGRARAPRVRVRRAGRGDAPRLPRHRQGPARRDARLPQELPDDDLRLVRHAHGRRGGARVQDAHVRHRGGRPRAGDLRDGEPPDRQGPRRRHGAVLGEVQGDEAVPPAGLRGAAGRQGARRSRRSA